jgi:hypothetical protein
MFLAAVRGMSTDIRFPQEVAMFTFGHIPAYQNDEKFEIGVSDDKRALTLTFSDFQSVVGGSNSPGPVSTRVFSLILPLEGDEKTAEIEFSLDGFVLALEGATASLVFSVNGQTTVADFPAGSDQDFVQTLKFAAETPSEARLCVFLLVGRDSGNTDAEAHLSVTTIDAEILPRPQ